MSCHSSILNPPAPPSTLCDIASRAGSSERLKRFVARPLPVRRRHIEALGVTAAALRSATSVTSRARETSLLQHHQPKGLTCRRRGPGSERGRRVFTLSSSAPAADVPHLQKCLAASSHQHDSLRFDRPDTHRTPRFRATSFRPASTCASFSDNDLIQFTGISLTFGSSLCSFHFCSTKFLRLLFCSRGFFTIGAQPPFKSALRVTAGQA